MGEGQSGGGDFGLVEVVSPWAEEIEEGRRGGARASAYKSRGRSEHGGWGKEDRDIAELVAEVGGDDVVVGRVATVEEAIEGADMRRRVVRSPSWGSQPAAQLAQRNRTWPAPGIFPSSRLILLGAPPWPSPCLPAFHLLPLVHPPSSWRSPLSLRLAS